MFYIIYVKSKHYQIGKMYAHLLLLVASEWLITVAFNRFDKVFVWYCAIDIEVPSMVCSNSNFWYVGTKLWGEFWNNALIVVIK